MGPFAVLYIVEREKIKKEVGQADWQVSRVPKPQPTQADNHISNTVH
jgi:hypothetical protein